MEGEIRRGFILRPDLPSVPEKKIHTDPEDGSVDESIFTTKAVKRQVCRPSWSFENTDWASEL